VIDPLVERNLKFALESRDQFLKLVAAVPTASKQYSASVYLVIRESIAQAAEARLKRIAAGPKGSYTEDDAVYDLAQAYLRGAVLSFHFYESLIGFERVGIRMEDFFEQMLATVKWEREAARAKDFEAVVARVAEKRARAPKPGEAERLEAASPIVKKIMASDDLIRQRRFAEAQPVLEEVLAVEPKNARALYGMARVMTQTPSKAELDANADENDKIQAQHERLKIATRLFRDAIANAAPEAEAWLVQWSYVYLGRIFDFQEFRVDAVAEYEKAIAMGPVAGGALKEALEGKEKPFGQKQ
jgi:tetratricopeptide (TPR) repeat protein